MTTAYIGIAGWSIPAAIAGRFPGPGTHLERYARVLPAVEINTTFYRPHQPQTYARWAASTPEEFRFAVKVPKSITHSGRLKNLEPLKRFLDEVQNLGDKLGPLLVQLPPSLVFDPETAGTFFHELRSQFSGGVVCEPRHRSWFQPAVESVLSHWQIARVAADPAPHPTAGEPGGWHGLVYYRLHGSPRMYYSTYPEEYLQRLALKLASYWREMIEIWCIFDNTAEFAALGNGLALLDLV